VEEKDGYYSKKVTRINKMMIVLRIESLVPAVRMMRRIKAATII